VTESRSILAFFRVRRAWGCGLLVLVLVLLLE
jgi:hypothetical protein